MGKPPRASKPSPRLRKRTPLGFERLEDRTLPDGSNIFAQFSGILHSPRDVQQIPIALSPSDITLAGTHAVLGFWLKQAPQSTLAPPPVFITTANGTAVTPVFVNPNMAGDTQSLTLASLSYGNYTLTINGDGGSVGAFQLDVFLAGDADGDHRIDLADGQLIRELDGSVAGDGRYRVEADSNLDGKISSFDYTQWRYNLGVSTPINPLTLTLQTPPGLVQLPSGVLATKNPPVTLRGTTEPGVTVRLGTEDDGKFDEGSTVADSSGNFAFPVVLSPGANNLQVMASDAFGQQQTASLGISLDVQPPVITITSPPSGQVTNQNVTVIGQVTDNLSGVASLQAAVDNGPYQAVSFDAAGNFSFTSALPLDGTADGSHTIHFVGTDRVGNVSGPTDVAFTLETCPPWEMFQDWTPGQMGGSPTGHGTVDIPDCGATLHEGDSFDVTLSHPFVIPDQPSVLAITYSAPSFDSSSQGRIKDAFEAAFVDATGQPLVHTISPGKDAFFNITADQPPDLAAGTSLDNQTLTLNLAGLAPGTTGTLVLRLVNNDGAGNS
jgi:Bacterial Ig domain